VPVWGAVAKTAGTNSSASGRRKRIVAILIIDFSSPGQFGNFRITAPLLGAPLAVLGSTTSRAKRRERSVVTVGEIALF
jgi:hypothetical protein